MYREDFHPIKIKTSINIVKIVKNRTNIKICYRM